MMSQEVLVQLLVSAMTQGCIYTFMALQFVILYSITQIFNLAAGEFVMLGGLMSISFHQLGVPLPLAIVMALVANCAIAAITWFGFLHYSYSNRKPPLTLLLIVAVLSLVISGIAYLIWGTGPRNLPEFYPFSITISNVVISSQDFMIWGVLVAVVVSFFLWLDHTLTGKAFRACSERPLMTRLMGINPDFVALISFMLTALVGGIAGIVLAPKIGIDYAMGIGLSTKGALAAMLGGMDRAHGAILGGFFLGFVECFAGHFLSTEFMDVIAIGCMMVILFWRPEGIFGIREERYCRK